MNNPNQAPKNIIIEGLNSLFVDSSFKIPSHIRKLLNSIKPVREEISKVTKILRSFSNLVKYDSTLNDVFESFGWDSATNLFKKTIVYDEFISKIEECYNIQIPIIDEKNNERHKLFEENLPFHHTINKNFATNHMYESVYNTNNNITDWFLSNSAKALFPSNCCIDDDESSLLIKWKPNEKPTPIQDNTKKQDNNSNFSLMCGQNTEKIIEKSNLESIFSLKSSQKQNKISMLKRKKKIKTSVKSDKINRIDNCSSQINCSFENAELDSLRSYGLKDISYWVMKIVREKKTTNYKEISDLIVNKIKTSDKKIVNNKDEKNIRRRIYDSLNVMKALSLFKNEKNKTIIWNNECFEEKIEYSNNIHEKLPSHNIKLNEIIQQIDEKQRKIETVTFEILKLDAQKRVLEQFICRNKEENIKKIYKKLEDENERIYFPFVLIEFPDRKNNSVSIVSNNDKTKLHLAFKEEFEIYGDLDSVMKIHHRSCEKVFKYN